MSAYRYLRGNKASWSPQHVVCVDTETVSTCVDGKPKDRVLSFRLGCFSHCRKRGAEYSEPTYATFSDREVFWSELERLAKPRSVLWLFAHNVGFDSISLGFWQLLDCGRFTRQWPRDRSKGSKSGERQSELRSGLLVTADPPTIVEVWTRNGGLIRMVDTLNYFQASIAEIGRWVGLDKLPMPDPWDSDSDWSRYCQRDTEILHNAVMGYVRWVSEHKLGIFATTLASQAMHGFRHTSPAKSIVLHDNTGAQKLESEAYRGGEVLVSKVGRIETGPGGNQLDLQGSWTPPERGYTRQIHHLDVNSLFPAAMAANAYPRNLVDYRRLEKGSKNAVRCLGPDCIAECLVDTTDYGVFARRRQRSGRFTGFFVATLCGPELQEALQRQVVVAVRSWARYELADLFGDWVRYWWDQRIEHTRANDFFGALLCKRIMNSLYGKFGQRAYEWIDVPGMRAIERWGSWVNLDLANNEITHYRSIAGTVQRKSCPGYAPHAFVAIPAFVTSYARERMRLLREVAGQYNVYYQGIDSLYVSDDGLRNLRAAGEVDTARLGALRLEASTDTAEFLGWGLYRFGDRYVRTSISRGAIECVPGEFEQDNFTRLTTYLLNEPTEGIEVKRVLKTLAASSPVGVVDAHGWVSPLPAVWGDNPAETVDPRGYYYDVDCPGAVR